MPPHSRNNRAGNDARSPRALLDLFKTDEKFTKSLPESASTDPLFGIHFNVFQGVLTMDPIKINKLDVVNWENPQIRQILADQLDMNLHVSETISRIEKLTQARPSVNIVTQRVRRYREKRHRAMNPGISSILSRVPDFKYQSRTVESLLPKTIQPDMPLSDDAARHRLSRFGNVKANVFGGVDLFLNHLTQQHDKPIQDVHRIVNCVPSSSGIETLLSVPVSHTLDPSSTFQTTKDQSKCSLMPLQPNSNPIPCETELPSKFKNTTHGISSLPGPSELTVTAVSPAIPNYQTSAAASFDALSNKNSHVRVNYLLQVRKAAMCCLDQVNFLHTIGENTIGHNNSIGFNYADKAALDDLYSALYPLVRFHEPHFTLETGNFIRRYLNDMKEEMDFSDSPLVDLTDYRLDQFKSILGILEKKLVTIIEISYDNAGSMNTVTTNVASCIQSIWVLVNELRSKK
uniref:Uncharacterized protein n=1 Tax=Panagrellus redivivus TaxID=6233 RepID=A0A7E4UR47_PANRE